MDNFTEKDCPKCGQRLRIPDSVGGLKLICPSCGHHLHSDFKFGGKTKKRGKNVLITLFELPTSIINYLGKIFSR